MGLFDSQVEYSDENFKKVKLEASRVSKKEFTDCLFSNCSFRETVFRDCKFIDCTFQNCDLDLINVEGSSFGDIKFEKSRIVGVNWTLASWSRFLSESPINFYECVIDFSTFIGLSLRKIILKKCNAQEVEFSEADLTDASFSGTNLAKSRFSHTNLTRANFEDATNYTIDLATNTITKARFSLPEALSLLYSLDIILVE